MMNLSDDIEFSYIIHSKFTIYTDYEHLLVEKEFNTSVSLLLCTDQHGLFLAVSLSPRYL